ncbi:hypothetical protein AC578_3931 [Pseudocercospora eumusae]|uniref:Terpene synthase n=1 Tax=Pseudocercospora eumusae TaxID=321146 RepID=A0A139GXJ1_9PEZI|nr:hypothetical protein AC578_3931 [Pseudocercospora eumusae]
MRKNTKDSQLMVPILCGRAFTIPSLNGVLAEWARGTNEGYPELKPVLAGMFEQVLKDPSHLKKLNQDDYALCGAGMYMYGDFASLKTMTLLTCWLFFFDDKVDHKDGELFDNEAKFAGVAKEALEYVSNALGLSEDYREPEGGVDDFIKLFDQVGESLKALNEETRRIFLDDFQFYLCCLIKEQADSTRGTIRSFDDYMAIRRGTVCMYTICSAVETASGVSLRGSAAVPVEELRELWTEIRDLMIYVNDLYSFRNELYSGNGASLITLYLERDKDMDTVVSEIISRIGDSKARFDTKADKTLSRFDVSDRIVLMRYFDSLRALVTGYHTWW